MQDDTTTNDIISRCNNADFATVFIEMANNFLNQPVYEIDNQSTNLEAFIEHNMFEVTVKGICKIMDLGKRLFVLCF